MDDEAEAVGTEMCECGLAVCTSPSCRAPGFRLFPSELIYIPPPSIPLSMERLTIDRVENGQIITLGIEGKRHVFSNPSAEPILEFVRAWLMGLEPKS